MTNDWTERLPRVMGAGAGMLIFAAMLLRGALVNNSFDVVLVRALVGLLAGVVLGWTGGWVAVRVLQEHCGSTRGGAAADSTSVPPGGTPSAESGS
ncbi:MAG: hypothetical protein L6Q92_00460 [Phycisphaerae bacterium]|nr:hypothetical protein [Phycisphaerae bacterium]